MSRIFLGLASLDALALLFTFAVGFFAEGRADLPTDAPLTAAPSLFTVHFLSGLFAAFLTLFVHCLILTYFMGTGRWIEEVVAAYRLPPALWLDARTLKIRVLPCVLGSTLGVITAAVLGAAADRGLVRGLVHLVCAVVTVAFNFWSYFVEYAAVRGNAALLGQIMAEVTRMRAERGLE